MTRRTNAERRLARIVIALVTTLVIISGLAHAASYVYDANGRLRAITASSGASSEYIYDALGNLVAVDSVPSGAKAIFAFTPNHGPVGQTVTILGTGFSTTKASDTVKFNGTVVPTTSISTATATQLVVTVPAGATTGPISVTVGGVTATSLDNFYVTTDSGGQPPTVTSFTPTVANAGMSITTTGSHFVSLAGPTQAGVGVYTSTVTPTSDTQLNFAVPANTGSGYVTVTTPYGTGSSAQPLIVVPASVGAANVSATATLTVGGSAQAVNIASAGKHAALILAVTGGQWISLQFSQLVTTPSAGSINADVYDSTGAQVVSVATIASTSLSLHLPEAKRTGFYTVIISLGSNTSAQFNVAAEAAALLSSTTSTLSTSVVGQSKRGIFLGATSENFSLGISNITTSPAGQLITYQVLRDSGAIAQGVCGAPGCHAPLNNLPISGFYGVLVGPSSNTTMSVSLTVSQDVAINLVPNQASALALSKPGQVALITFNGTAGQYIGLNFGSVAPSRSGDSISITATNPDGTPASYLYTGFTSNVFVNEPPLTQTGTYTLQLEVQHADTLTAQITLVPNPVAAITIDGSAVAQSTTYGGEAVYYTFSSTLGQYLSLGLASLSTSDGQKVTTWGAIQSSCTPSACHILINNLQTSGPNYIEIVPSATATFSATASLSNDISATLTPNTPYSLNLAKPGQTARLTFAGTTGQYLGYNLTNIVSSGSGHPIIVSTYFPNGTQNPGGSVTSAANVFWNLPSLSQTGTYVVQIEPTNADTATAQVTLTADPDPTLVVNGSSVTITTTSANEDAVLTFSATAGQNLSLAFDNVSLSPYTLDGVYYTIFEPNSAGLANGSFGSGSSHQLLTALPMTGVYTVTFHPGDARNTMTFRATLTSDLTGTLTAGTAMPVNLTTPGQTARLTFSGTAGQNVAIYTSGITTTPSGLPVTVTIFNPDGTTNTSASPTSNQLTTLQTLTQTGTYVVQVEPYLADPATAQITLAVDPISAITIDGSTVNESTNVPRELAFLTFSGTAGQNLSLGITNASTSPSGGDFGIELLNPSQTQIAAADCPNSACHLAIPTLPATGTYTIKMTPSTAETVTFSATLYSDLTGNLVPNTAFPLSVGHPGQVAHLTFSGTAGQNAALYVSSITTVPAGDTATVTVFNPDGTTAGNLTTSFNSTLNLPPLTQTGTYVVQVELKNADTGSLQLTLSASAPAVLVVDGAAVPESTGDPNQLLNLSFSGTAGSSVTLAFSSVNPSTTSFSNTSVYDPTSHFMQVNEGSCATSGCHWTFENLPATGTYTIKVTPSVATSFNAQVMSVVAATLTASTPYALNLSSPGRSAILTFSGTAGNDEGLYLTSLATIPSTDTPEILIYYPDGSGGGSVPPDNNTVIEIDPLTQTGTFTALIAPLGADTTSMQLTLTPDPVATGLTINGSAVTLAPTYAGQWETATFTGTANEALHIKFTNAATVPAGGQIDFIIYDSSFNYYYSGGCSSSTCNIQMSALPAAGTYTVYVYPDDQTRKESCNVQLTSP